MATSYWTTTSLWRKDPLAIEGPAADLDDDEDEGDDEGEDEFKGEEDVREANKILDQLELPNYDDVEKRLGETEMTATRPKNYLDKVIKDAEKRRRQVIAMKSNATKKFKAGEITEELKKDIHKKSDQNREEINDYIKHYKFKSKSIQGYGRQRGRGAYLLMMQKKCCKLILIIAEMEAGNTSLKMRNMGQSILDALLHSKHMNKQQYQKLPYYRKLTLVLINVLEINAT